MVDFAQSMRKITLDAVASTNPAAIVLGTVETVNPLSIKVDQKLIINEPNLILTRNVMDHEIEMTVNHKTEIAQGGSGYGEYDAHSHDYLGKKSFLVHNGLSLGDSVILIKNQGGQQYVVLDKVVDQ